MSSDLLLLRHMHLNQASLIKTKQACFCFLLPRMFCMKEGFEKYNWIFNACTKQLFIEHSLWVNYYFSYCHEHTWKQNAFTEFSEESIQ